MRPMSPWRESDMRTGVRTATGGGTPLKPAVVAAAKFSETRIYLGMYRFTIWNAT